jgi:hypothetical protein
MNRLELFRILSASRNNNKLIFAIVSILVCTLILDISFARLSTLFYGELSDFGTNFIAFIIIVAVTMIAQYFILSFVRQRTKYIGNNKMMQHINVTRIVVTIVQYVLWATLILAILQIAMTKEYYSSILSTISVISYSVATMLLLLISYRFFSWYKSDRNSVVLLYGLASVGLLVNAALSIAIVAEIATNIPIQIGQHGQSNYYIVVTGSLGATIDLYYFISFIVSFTLTWAATALLLYHYSNKIGKIKYWVVIGLPLGYFFAQFVTFFLNSFEPLLNTDPFQYGVILTFIFILSKAAGGILFSVAFWSIVRSLNSGSVVRSYMVIAAYGFLLLFISNQVTVIGTAPYPPFGLATLSFTGLSSYLILVGLYSSAVSASLDSKLRQSIRKFAIAESKLLDSIGTAQMEQEIENKVMKMANDSERLMVDETGIHSSLSDNEIKQYLHEVLSEVKEIKNKDDEIRG